MELVIDRLTKQFQNKIAVDRVSLRLNNGVYGLLGTNGAGKTTLMRMLCGILQPTSGTIAFDGMDVSEEGYRAILGYLPQDFGYYPEFTAMDFLLYMAALKGLPKHSAKRRANELLELVGLQDMGRKKIKTFSGGMKQRLGIAQALLGRPKLLICDEPTSALDPVGRKEILDILLAIKDQTTVLFSTHILSDVERICTDVAFLQNGVVSIQGKLSDIKTRYRSNGYMIEAENDSDIVILKNAFPKTKEIDRNKVTFSEDSYSSSEVLHFIADHHISLLKMERLEPTLEDLFMEVTEQ